MKYSLVDKILGDQVLEYILNKLEEGNWEDPKTIVELVADAVNIDLEEEYKETNIEKIHEIQNRQDKCYLVETSCTDNQLNELREQMKSELINKQGRVNALIFIRNDITEISELNPEDVEASVKPWLQKGDQ